MGAPPWTPSFKQLKELGAAGELAEILKYDQHLAMFLVQYAGKACVLCACLESAFLRLQGYTELTTVESLLVSSVCLGSFWIKLVVVKL